MEIDEIQRRASWSQASSYKRRIEAHKKEIRRIDTRDRIIIWALYAIYAVSVVALLHFASLLVF